MSGNYKMYIKKNGTGPVTEDDVNETYELDVNRRDVKQMMRELDEFFGHVDIVEEDELQDEYLDRIEKEGL